MGNRDPAATTLLKIVRATPTGDVVVATVADPRIVGLVADLALAAQRGRLERDPIIAALRAGQRTALRRLAAVT
jgi:hypothetical protein